MRSTHGSRAIAPICSASRNSRTFGWMPDQPCSANDLETAMAIELYDPRIPPRQDCIVGEAIDRWARDNPDKVFVLFADGTSWTFRELRDVVRQTALGLQQLGVKQDDY